MLDREAEQAAFIRARHSRGGHGHRNALNGNHFAHHTGCGVHLCSQHRIEVERVRCNDLKVAKQRIG